MKEFAEAILMMIDAKIITAKEAKEIYLRAVEDWLKPHVHTHEGDDYDGN